MKNETVKTILTVIVLILLMATAMSLLRWMIHILLPVSIIIVAVYIVVKIFKGKKL